MNLNYTLKLIICISLCILAIPIILAQEDEQLSPISIGFERLNTFFTGEGYKEYSKIIDFFVFFVIFTTVSLIGLKAMFKDKETNRQIIALAIAIGVMSSLALIFGGTFLGKEISIMSLFPYALGFLIFCVILLPIFLIFHFLMGKKHPVWAFIIALLITLLLYFLLIKPISLSAIGKDIGKTGKSISKGTDKSISSGKKQVSDKTTKGGGKKDGETTNGKTDGKNESTKEEGKKEEKNGGTKPKPCDEIRSFSERKFFEKIWDKTKNEYHNDYQTELTKLEAEYKKCKEDKTIEKEDFYTATMNYHTALTKGWFMIGQKKGEDVSFDKAFNYIKQANIDTDGNDVNVKNSKRREVILDLWYGLIANDMSEQLTILNGQTDIAKKIKLRFNIKKKFEDIKKEKSLGNLVIYSRKYLD